MAGRGISGLTTLQLSTHEDDGASTIDRHGRAEALTGLDVNDCGSAARDGEDCERISDEQEEDEAARLQHGSDGGFASRDAQGARHGDSGRRATRAHWRSRRFCIFRGTMSASAPIIMFS